MPVEGVNCIKKVKADASVEYRYYAWRGKGAPCFWVEPHRKIKPPYSRKFVDAFNAAIQKKIEGDNFDALAASYLDSEHYKTRAPATQSEYRRLVDKARSEFTDTPLHIIADPRFRADIIRYRDKFKATPREADNAVLGVSLVLGHAKDMGKLSVNPASRIANLYEGNPDKRPWTDAQIATFTAGADRQLLDAFWLIRHFGMRRKDSIERLRADDKDTHMTFITSKGKRKRRTAVIPILPDGRAFLDDLYRRNTALLSALAERYAKQKKDVALLQPSAAYMLLTSRGQRWTAERSITHAFEARWMEILDPEGALRTEKRELLAELEDPDTGHNRRKEAEARLAAIETALDYPTPHRLRNNAATAMMIAGIDDRTIADAMGWSKEDVEEMRRVYVDREALVSATIIKLRDAAKPA